IGICDKARLVLALFHLFSQTLPRMAARLADKALFLPRSSLSPPDRTLSGTPYLPERRERYRHEFVILAF
ncbi:MAG TPA: hypothetical protein PKE00_09655, partial [Planctomycetota bacterium]|nr:hypothetical protein [Planctomycetota bacterium]